MYVTPLLSIPPFSAGVLNQIVSIFLSNAGAFQFNQGWVGPLESGFSFFFSPMGSNYTQSLLKSATSALSASKSYLPNCWEPFCIHCSLLEVCAWRLICPLHLRPRSCSLEKDLNGRFSSHRGLIQIPFVKIVKAPQ